MVTNDFLSGLSTAAVNMIASAEYLVQGEVNYAAATLQGVNALAAGGVSAMIVISGLTGGNVIEKIRLKSAGALVLAERDTNIAIGVSGDDILYNFTITIREDDEQ